MSMIRRTCSFQAQVAHNRDLKSKHVHAHVMSMSMCMSLQARRSSFPCPAYMCISSTGRTYLFFDSLSRAHKIDAAAGVKTKFDELTAPMRA